MTAAGLAALCAALAALLLVGPVGRGLHRLRAHGAGPPNRGSAGRIAAAATCLGAVVLVGASTGPRFAVLGSSCGGVLAGLRALHAARRRRSAAADRRRQVIEACGVLAADLRAGRSQLDALAGAASACPALASAAHAARLGGDVRVALQVAGSAPGAEGLRAVAAAWAVAEHSGVALASIAERLATALRSEQAVRRQVAVGLAGTRSTARLLAGLPLFGSGLGYAVGAHPLAFLTSTPIGWACLACGLALAAGGLAWIERLAGSCESVPGGTS